MFVGEMLMLIAVGTNQYILHVYHHAPIHILSDALFYGLHAVGAIPFIEHLTEHINKNREDNSNNTNKD